MVLYASPVFCSKPQLFVVNQMRFFHVVLRSTAHCRPVAATCETNLSDPIHITFLPSIGGILKNTLKRYSNVYHGWAIGIYRENVFPLGHHLLCFLIVYAFCDGHWLVGVWHWDTVGFCFNHHQRVCCTSAKKAILSIEMNGNNRGLMRLVVKYSQNNRASLQMCLHLA